MIVSLAIGPGAMRLQAAALLLFWQGGNWGAPRSDSVRAGNALIRRESRESEIAVVRAASQGLCPFQADALRCIGVEIKPANVRQDFHISMTISEFAEAASFI